MVALLDINYEPDAEPTVYAPFQNSFSDSRGHFRRGPECDFFCWALGLQKSPNSSFSSISLFRWIKPQCVPGTVPGSRCRGQGRRDPKSGELVFWQERETSPRAGQESRKLDAPVTMGVGGRVQGDGQSSRACPRGWRCRMHCEAWEEQPVQRACGLRDCVQRTGKRPVAGSGVRWWVGREGITEVGRALQARVSSWGFLLGAEGAA